MSAVAIIDARSPRAKQEGSASDNWCTPTWFTDMLPPVDLDPFSNAHATVDADTKWTLEAGDNGEGLRIQGNDFLLLLFNAGSGQGNHFRGEVYFRSVEQEKLSRPHARVEPEV